MCHAISLKETDALTETDRAKAAEKPDDDGHEHHVRVFGVLQKEMNAFRQPEHTSDDWITTECGHEVSVRLSFAEGGGRRSFNALVTEVADYLHREGRSQTRDRRPWLRQSEPRTLSRIAQKPS